MKTLHAHLPALAKLAFFSFLILLIPSLSYGGDVSFQWTAHLEPFTGYKLYYKTGANSAPPYDGTGLKEGASPILIGKVTTYTVTGLSTEETYHFLLTAYSDTEESTYSAIVTITSEFSSSPIIINMREI